MKGKKIGYVIIFLIVWVCISAFLGVPQLMKINTLKKKKKALSNQTQSLKNELADFEAKSSSRAKTRAELILIKKSLVDDVDYLVIFQKLIKEYKNNSLIDLQLFEPEIGEDTDASNKKNHQTRNNNAPGKKNILPLRLSFITDYGTMIDYIKYIENIAFITSFRNIIIKSSNDPKKLYIDMTIELFAEKANSILNLKKDGKISSIQKKLESIPTLITFGSKKDVLAKEKADAFIDFALNAVIDEAAILVGENIYNIGDNVNGWKLMKVSLMEQEATFKKGKNIKTLKSE